MVMLTMGLFGTRADGTMYGGAMGELGSVEQAGG